MLRLLKRIGTDIAAGKNIEAYAVTGVALVLAILGVIGDVIPVTIQMAAILAALALLVFKSAETHEREIPLDEVLRDRQSYGKFSDFIKGGAVLWVYGPSAVNVMSSWPDIDREIMNRGGEVRVILQDPTVQPSLDILHQQLDQDSYLLETDITRSISILTTLKKRGSKVDYRFLSYSPGFSMVIVDPDGRNGRAVIEFFGYSNQMITDRMHIEINRDQSNYWFEYWAKQFSNMWESAHPPEGT